jgi:hypothetical protein
VREAERLDVYTGVIQQYTPAEPLPPRITRNRVADETPDNQPYNRAPTYQAKLAAMRKEREEKKKGGVKCPPDNRNSKGGNSRPYIPWDKDC